MGSVGAGHVRSGCVGPGMGFSPVPPKERFVAFCYLPLR